MMPNRSQIGLPTNHDRDAGADGVNGGGATVKLEEDPPDSKGKGKEIDSGSSMVGHAGSPWGLQAATMEEPPDDIPHITTDMMPLSLLLTRLAQFSHASLQDHIAELASKPLPQNAPNGNASHHATGAEDTSPESLEKKAKFLNFIQELHSKWVKALVITEWSKKAGEVGKLIDLRSHLASELEVFNTTFRDLVKMNRDMHWAKVPSPDLKTALEVLAHGKVSWLPDFGYLEPPPLSLEEKEHWLHRMNVALSARLTIHEWEKIPEPFRGYTIDSGRVTFRVKGEFEVDLTIADEDFETQFWFIDFRYLFNPAPANLTDRARHMMETKVNEALATEGLFGCYKYLHELTLTAKIVEFTRQAVELSRSRWVDTLKVERLQRASSIQYWLHRPHSQSWIILGVNAGSDPEAAERLRSSSHLALRWFRDGKEVKGCDIPFDVDTISTERLLTTVVATHIEHILSSIFNKLSSKPRFAQQQARLALEISKEKPEDSGLTMQLVVEEDVTARINPMTGAFFLLPRTSVMFEGEKRLNSMPNPADEGAGALEQLRWLYTIKDWNSRGKALGWSVLRPPISADELKTIVFSGGPSSREAFQAVCVRKSGWDPPWLIITSMSLSGDGWWLVQLCPAGRVKTFADMPMSSRERRLSETFLENLAEYGSLMMSQLDDLGLLDWNTETRFVAESQHDCPNPSVKVPAIHLRTSILLQPPGSSENSAPAPWAAESVSISYPRLAPYSPSLHGREARGDISAEACLVVTNRSKFEFIKGNLAPDIQYDPLLGMFKFQLRAQAGAGVFPLLSARLRALQRLIDFVEAIRRAGKDAVLQSVTLLEILFTYSNNTPAAITGGPQEQQSWLVRLDLSAERGVDVFLEHGNPHLRAIDYLRDMANSSQFETLPTWLVLSLSLYRALDRLEDSWEKVLANAQGSCYVFNKALNWVTIRFALPGPSGRRINLDIKSHKRKGELEWHISRSKLDANAGNENDEFNKVLQQRVWSASGDGFKGLSDSAAATLDHGIENLLALISESMLSLVGTAPQPQQLQQAQQAQTQHQGQGQGPRGGPSKNDSPSVVVID